MPSDGKIRISVQEALEHLLTRSVYQDRALLASAEVIKQLTLHLRNPGRYSEELHRTSIDQLQAATDSLRVLDQQWRRMHTDRMDPAAAGTGSQAAPPQGPHPVPATGAVPPPPLPADIAAQQAAALAAVRTLPVQPTGPARQTAADLAAVFDGRRDDGAIM